MRNELMCCNHLSPRRGTVIALNEQAPATTGTNRFRYNASTHHYMGSEETISKRRSSLTDDSSYTAVVFLGITSDLCFEKLDFLKIIYQNKHIH